MGERTGQTYATGDLLKLRLGEANPLTGAMKFEPLDSDGNPIKPRGDRHEHKKRNSSHRKGPRGGPKKGGRKDDQGKHPVGQRGRPGNIRHQGRKK